MADAVPLRIAVVGDRQPDHETHPATTAALGHAANALSVRVDATWLATDAVSVERLAGYDGVWIAPGSPYRSLEGALQAIVFVRTQGRLLLGTCAGFQHIVLEYARNVLSHRSAQHAEYAPDADDLFVTPLSCSLAGQSFEVRFSDASRAHRAYGVASATERYYCNFGLNPDRAAELEAAGLAVTGRDQDGGARIVEVAAHRFFVGTLFVPQVSSAPGRPHPLVVAFVAAAADRQAGEGASTATEKTTAAGEPPRRLLG
jgi:CTP synthase (UTP-ammonia lyase)